MLLAARWFHPAREGHGAGSSCIPSRRLAKAIDKAVFPGLQGGPLMHVIAAKAVACQHRTTTTPYAFPRAMSPEPLQVKKRATRPHQPKAGKRALAHHLGSR